MVDQANENDIKPKGSYINGDISLDKGDFVGRDKVTGLGGEDIAKILEVLLKYFSKDYLQKPENLDTTLHNYQYLHQELYEWKELHNYMDRILQTFEPFSTQVLNSKMPLPVRELNNLWYPVNLTIKELLEWAGKINWIGTPFLITAEGEFSGEVWAIDLENTRGEFLGILERAGKETNNISANQTIWNRLITRYLKENSVWWDHLVDQTRQFRHLNLQYMHFADHQLRETATRLYIESQSARMR